MAWEATEPFQQEVDRNYESTWQDARKTAKLLYKEEPFSIQKVEKQDVDLGFYSHAVSCC